VGVVDFDFAALLRHTGVRGWGVPRDEGGDHDKKENCGEGENGEESWVEADEGVDCHCGECVCGVVPGQNSEELMLEYKDYADPVSIYRNEYSRENILSIRGVHALH